MLTLPTLRRFILVVVAVTGALLVFSASVSAARPFPMIPDLYPYLVHMRGTEALGMTDLREIARSSKSPWVVAEVQADSLSGRIVLQQDGQPPVFIVSGQYKIVYQLGSPVSTLAGAYNWPGSRGTLGEAGQRVFGNSAFGAEHHGSGNVVICLDDENAIPADRFAEAVSVPKAREGDIVPAVTFLRANPDLLARDLTDAAKSKWRSLLKSPNFYLQLTAFRALAQDGSLSSSDLDVALDWSDLTIFSAAVCVACRYPWMYNRGNCDRIERLVEHETSLIKLEAVANGLAAAEDIFNMTFDDEASFYPLVPHDDAVRITALMATVRKRLNALDPNGGSADLVWCAIDYACRLNGK